MPARRPKTIPKCFDCKKVDLHEMDGHWHCLKCLTITHDPIDCEVCSDLPKPVREIRALLVQEAVEQGTWPTNWLERLNNIQMVSQHEKSKSKQDSEKSDKSKLKSPVEKTTKSKKVLSKKIISSSSSSSETDEDQSNQTEDKNGEVQSKLSTNQGQLQDVTPGGEGWQLSITSTVSTLAANMQAMMEQMQKMAESQTKTKSKKSTKKTKSKHDSGEPAKKRRKTKHSSPPPSTSTSNVTSEQQTPEETYYHYEIPEELMQPSLPSTPIPRYSDQSSLHQSDLVYNSSESDSELEVDINRSDKRKLYLQGLKSLVPGLKHSQQSTSQSESGHFSLMTRAPNTNIMPMLDEVFTQVQNTATKDCYFAKFRKKILSNTSKYYTTTEPAESGFLQPRTVPRELLQHVYPNKLSQKGASGKSATLSSNTKEGVKEQQALGSFKHATNSIRLANNMEIGIEAQGSLIKRCQRNIQRINQFEVPEEVHGLLGSLTTSLHLMNQTLFDIKSSNNDLMKMSLGQYNQSMTDRKEAWLTATDLPPGLIQELKDSDHTVSTISDQKGSLKMFTDQDIQMLKEYNVSEKETAIVRACNVRAQSQRGRGRGQQTRSRPYNRGASTSAVRGFHLQPSFQVPRARGRGRSSRPRGQQQSFRGQPTQKHS